MTTTNRYRAGGPPPLVLHRGPPLDFVLPADDDQAVSNGFDQAMNAPINKDWSDAEERSRQGNRARGLQNAIPRTEQDVETVEQYDQDAASIAWVGWLLLAALFTFVCMGIGYMAGRYFA